MENKLKLAFIGGGINSAVGYTHYTASRLDGKFVPIGGCFSCSRDVNFRSGEKYFIPEEMVFSTPKECVKKLRDSADAFVILTPTPNHFDVIMKCVSEGVSIICEKPLCTSTTETEILKNTIQHQGVFFTTTFNYTGYPMLREMKSMLNNGLIGDINFVRAEMLQEGYLVLDNHGESKVPQKWRLDQFEIPGIHLDLASHLHEILYYLIGWNVESVYSQTRSTGNFEKVEDVCVAVVTALDRFNRKVLCDVTFGKAFLGQKNGLRFHIFGKKGSLFWEQDHAEQLLYTNQNGTSEIITRGDSRCKIANQIRYTRFKGGHPVGFIEAFANVYSDIYDALVEYQSSGIWKSEEVFDIEYSFKNMMFLSALTQSNSLNKRIIL